MAVNPIPDGYHAVTPYLSLSDAAAGLEFYKKAFGARELFRMPMPDGRVGHAEMQIGDSRVMMADEFPAMGNNSPKTLGGTTISLMIYVTDVDAMFKQALAAGATELKPVKDQFYGDRSGCVTDPFGHIWTLSTHKEDVAPDEMVRRMDEMMKQHHKHE